MQHSTCLVIISVGKHSAAVFYIICLEDVLALVVGHASVCFLVAIAFALCYLKVCTSDGLTSCGIHYHIAYAIVGLSLGDGVHVGHMIQRANHRSRWVTLKLHHIHAHW